MSTDAFPWRGRRVLVTGCTGFLGGAVVRELLDNGANVVGLIRDRSRMSAVASAHAGRVHVIHGRPDNLFRLNSAMAVHEVAAVFHLAAHDPFAEDRATPAVIQAAKLYSARMPVVTARPARPLALANTEDHERGLSVARFGELFGPRDRKAFRIVPATAINLLAGHTVALPADGLARDFVFVRDAARACVRVAETALEHGPGDYSFRSGWLMSERHMAAAVRAVHAGTAPELPESAPPANPLEWAPQMPFAEALGETLAWYREAARAGRATPLRAAA